MRPVSPMRLRRRGPPGWPTCSLSSVWFDMRLLAPLLTRDRPVVALAPCSIPEMKLHIHGPKGGVGPRLPLNPHMEAESQHRPGDRQPAAGHDKLAAGCNRPAAARHQLAAGYDLSAAGHKQFPAAPPLDLLQARPFSPPATR